MASQEVSSLVQDFWVPVAQIGPVFALALVIEGRRIVVRWKVSEVRSRRFQGFALFTAATILWLVETTALWSMASGNGFKDSVLWAILGLSLVFFGLCLTPISGIAAAANVDVGLVIYRLLPNSAWWSYRKYLKQLEAATNRTVHWAMKAESAANETVQLAREVLRMTKLTARRVTEARSQDIEKPEPDGPVDPDVLASWSRLWDDPAGAVKAAKSEVKSTKAQYNELLRGLLEVEDSVKYLESARSTSGLFHFEPADLNLMEEVLKNFQSEFQNSPSDAARP